MKNFKKSLIAIALLLTTTAQANEQVNAEELVGKFYGGVHFTLMKPDEDRLDGINDDFELGNGFGLEFGYRYSLNTEFRFSYTDLNIEFEKATRNEDGRSFSLDALYFPTAQNFYVLGGLNHLDIDDAELSANVGLGYRHYFSERLAAYTEAKAHYQFDNEYIDQSAQIGLIYFFGETKKAAPARVEEPAVAPKQETVAAPVVVQPKDGDNDGVTDDKDKCLTTPANDKVDADGCTIFTEERSTYKLLINFDNNKAVVKPEYLAEVKKVADFLTKYPQVSITIDGHTSNQGSAAYNLTLSKKRADAIVALLVSDHGIEKSRLTAIGHGEESLLNKANTAQAHEENRRIEAKIDFTKKVKATK